eukprot:scaffold395471_cov19-Prasinocladus_malaysianus.AAC.1
MAKGAKSPALFASDGGGQYLQLGNEAWSNRDGWQYATDKFYSYVILTAKAKCRLCFQSHRSDMYSIVTDASCILRQRPQCIRCPQQFCAGGEMRPVDAKSDRKDRIILCDLCSA